MFLKKAIFRFSAVKITKVLQPMLRGVHEIRAAVDNPEILGPTKGPHGMTWDQPSYGCHLSPCHHNCPCLKDHRWEQWADPCAFPLRPPCSWSLFPTWSEITWIWWLVKYAAKDWRERWKRLESELSRWQQGGGLLAECLWKWGY